MKIFKQFTLILLGFFFVTELSAQDVPKNIIVEHFTNTRCSVCASRNPGFYTALNQNPNVIHIAFHPSAPYSTCLFSTQNKIQNDARTKYYGIFGSTPRFVINGVEKSGQATSGTVYNEFKNQTTPIDLQVKVAKAGTDIEVSFDVDIKSNNNIGSVNYLVVLVEDTVFYNAPNGEEIHRDVFRKSFSNDALPSFMIPQNAGNQYNFKGVIKTEAFWDLSRMYALVILTDSNKKVVQVAKSPLYNPNIVSSSTDQQPEIAQNVNIYPNPVTSELFFQSYSNESIQNIVIKNSIGQKVMEITPKVGESSINVGNLINGTYFLEVSFENRISVQKFIKI